MLAIVWPGLAMASAVPAAGLALIAAQSILSYFVVGVAKAYGPTWRRGSAPRDIVGSAVYGSPSAVRLLGVPGGSFAVAWATIGFEVLAPLTVLTVPTPTVTLAFVAGAVMFHLGVTLVMRLNTFLWLWAFIAPLPAIAWVATSMPW